MIDITTLQTFLQNRNQAPVVSIYLPQEPHQDIASLALRMKHLVAHTKAVMADTWPKQDFAPYQARFDTLFDTPKRTSDPHTTGFGYLCDGEQLAMFALESPVAEAAMVSRSPQILPLLVAAQASHDFDLLVLQQDKIALYHHDHDELHQVALPADAPQTLTGTLGEEQRGGAFNSIRQGGDTVSFHGHGDKSAEAEIDLRRFYAAVDDYVATHYSKPDHVPLALVGLSQNLAVFRAVSQNPYLGSVQLTLSPTNLTKQALARVASALRGDFDARNRHELLEALDDAYSANRVVIGASMVAQALAQQAVAHLLLQSPARVNGLLADGKIITDTPQAQHNNVLNDMALAALAQGGRVHLLPIDELVDPAAAITRYAQ